MQTIIIHDGTKVLELLTVADGAKLHSNNHVVSCADQAAALAQIAALGLQYDATPGQKLTRLFNSLTTGQQASYEPLLAPITALVESGQFAAACTAFQAAAVTPDLATVKAQMLAILKAARNGNP